METKKSGSIIAQYDGEFVLTEYGNKDFGEINDELSIKIRRQKGKVRLRKGEHNKETGIGYGKAHIERDNRFSQLKSNGFESAQDFVQYVAKNYTAIYEAKGSALYMVKQNKKLLWEAPKSSLNNSAPAQSMQLPSSAISRLSNTLSENA